jgi:hypothetical protein
MSKQRVVNAIPVEEGPGSIYGDLGYANSEDMMIKGTVSH